MKVIKATQPLLNLLKPNYVFVDDVIVALGSLGQPEAVNPLLKLAEQTVNIDERKTLSPSQHPIVEENPQAARTYWNILKSLGHLPGSAAIPFLCLACNDHAPDKREQALRSLVLVCTQSSNKSDTTYGITNDITQVIEHSLADPAVTVKMAALEGVGALKLFDSLHSVLKLCDSKEVSLRTKALETVSMLFKADLTVEHKTKVKAAVAAKLKSELDSHKRERLSNLLESLHS